MFYAVNGTQLLKFQREVHRRAYLADHHNAHAIAAVDAWKLKVATNDKQEVHIMSKERDATKFTKVRDAELQKLAARVGCTCVRGVRPWRSLGLDDKVFGLRGETYAIKNALYRLGMQYDGWSKVWWHPSAATQETFAGVLRNLLNEV